MTMSMTVTYHSELLDGETHTCTTSSLHSVNIKEGMYELWQRDGESLYKNKQTLFCKVFRQRRIERHWDNWKRTEPISWLRSFSVACLSVLRSMFEFLWCKLTQEFEIGASFDSLLLPIIPWSNWSLKGTKIPLMKKKWLNFITKILCILPFFKPLLISNRNYRGGELLSSSSSLNKLASSKWTCHIVMTGNHNLHAAWSIECQRIGCTFWGNNITQGKFFQFQ